MNTHEQLAERVEKLGTQIVEKLYAAGRRQLDGLVRVGAYRTNVSNGTIAEDALYLIDQGEGGGDLLSGCVGNGEDGRYIHGDFHAWRQYPTIDELHQFVALWPDIESAVNELQSQQHERSTSGLDALPESI